MVPCTVETEEASLGTNNRWRQQATGPWSTASQPYQPALCFSKRHRRLIRRVHRPPTAEIKIRRVFRRGRRAPATHFNIISTENHQVEQRTQLHHLRRDYRHLRLQEAKDSPREPRHILGFSCKIRNSLFMYSIEIIINKTKQKTRKEKKRKERKAGGEEIGPSLSPDRTHGLAHPRKMEFTIYPPSPSDIKGSDHNDT